MHALDHTSDWISRVTKRGEDLLAVGLFDDETRLLPSDPATAFDSGDVLAWADDVATRVCAAGSAEAVIWRSLSRLKLDPTFPDDVLAETAELVADFDVIIGTEDQTDLPYVTIDNEGSRDLDQALYLKRDGGQFVVYYALADASYFVASGSALFREAVRRGSTYYAPDRSVPMLPPALSEDLISLNANVLRRAIVFETTLAADGEVVSTVVRRARIRSRAKLTYDGVQAMFNDPDKHALGSADVTTSLLLMRDIGEIRRARARERGVVDFNRSEALFRIREGRFVIDQRDRNDVERWNEQLSLLCNMEGARMLQERLDHPDMHAIFRVHPAPLDARRRQLRETMDQLIELHGLDERWRYDPAADSDEESYLAAFVAALPTDPAVSRVLAAVERQVRYIHRASSFGSQAGRHFALGVDGYARFSSPMREVVGIFTHKELLEQLGHAAPNDRSLDGELREQVIEAANRSKSDQKQLEKAIELAVINQFLHDDLALDVAERPIRDGTIVGISSTRVYMLLDAFPIDLKLYVEDLESETGSAYECEAAQLRPVTGDRAFRLGDSVRLRVDSFEKRRRRWRFALL